MSQSKRYPHPLVMYKTLLYTRATSHKSQAESDIYLPANEKGQITSHKQKVESEMQQVTNITNSTIQNEVSSGGTKDLIQKDVSSGTEGRIQSDNNPSTQHDVDSFPQEDLLRSASLHSEGQSSGSLLNQSEISPTTSEGSDFTKLLPTSLQNILSGQSEITKIEGNIAHLIIINPMAKMMLSKKEHHDAICSAISQATGQTITHLECSFMSKDDYFAMQMGG